MTNLVLFRRLAFFTGILFFPSLAFSADNTSPDALLAWRMIWILIYIAGAIKCFSLVKKERTSTLCVLALGFVLLGLATTTTSSYLKDYHRVAMLFGIAIGLLSVFSGFILSIVGLALYGKGGEYTQGKRQAIAGIVIALVCACIFTFTIIKSLPNLGGGEATVASEKEYVFDELNFKFTPYNEKYRRFELESLSEVSTLTLQKYSKYYFMVIAEVAGVGVYSLDELVETVKNNADLALENISDWQREDVEVNGYSGVLLKMNAMVEGQEYSYVYWVYERNGYVFQLVSWSKKKHKKALDKEVSVLLAGFKLISDERIAGGSEALLKDYDSPYKYHANFSGSQWGVWDGLQEEYPGADFGGSIGEGAYFQVVPYCHGRIRPHENVINSAFLKTMSLSHDSESLRSMGGVSMGDLSGEMMSYFWVDDDVRFDARFTVLIGDECSFLIAMWTSWGEERTDEYMEDLRSKLLFDKGGRLPDGEQYLKQRAALQNYVGVYFHEMENYSDALKYFQRAHGDDSSYKTYLTNIFSAFNRLKHYQLGLDYYKGHAGLLAGDAEVLSWKAWFDDALGNNESAITAYEAAFSAGFRSDVDLNTYVETLIELELFERANRVIVDYAETSDSLDFLRKRARIKSLMGLSDEALLILDGAQEGRPFSADLVFDRIDIFDAIGEYKNILAQTKQLIDVGNLTAGTFFQKGKAEYYLGWYVQSKTSLESALERSPNNETIKSYLSQVSSRLGQGESTSISFSIEPVNLPSLEVDEKGNEKLENEYDSFYIRRATAFHYLKGERLRTTKYRNIRVLNAAGVERFSTIKMDFDPGYENAYVNSLVVKDGGGNVVSKGNRDEFYVLDKESDLADTDKTIHMPVVGLLPGYSVELVITTETTGEYFEFPYEHVYLASSRPIRQSLVYVEGDIGNINIVEQSVGHASKTEETLLWLERYPEPYRWEPMESNYTDVMASVRIGEGDKPWSTLGDDYLNSIKDRLVATEEIDALSEKITRGIKGENEKVQALAQYVQEKITYKALEFGVRGLIPNSARETLSDNFGDCKDHAVLLQGLLRSKKIDAKLALVHTDELVDPTIPSLNQFNHMVVAVKHGRDYIYYDTTDKNLVMDGRVPVGLSGNKTLILDEKSSHVADITGYKKTDEDLTISRDVRLKNTGAAHINERIQLSSYVGSFWRKYLKTIELNNQHDWAQRFVSTHNSDIKVQGVKISNLYRTSDPLVVEMDYIVPKNLGQSRGEWEYTDVSPWESYFLKTSSVHERKKPFQIHYPLTIRSDVKVSAEDGLALIYPKKSKGKNSGDFGSFKKTWKKQRNILNKKFVVSEQPAKYSAEKYESYVTFMKESLDSVKDTITVIEQ